MSHDIINAPESFKRCLPKDTIPQYTTSDDGPVCSRNSVRLEKKMHAEFEGWLKIKGWPYIHSRMDKRPTIAPGFPDFCIWGNGQCVAIEFKVAKDADAAWGDCSTEQKKWARKLLDQKIGLAICTSLAQAILVTVRALEPRA